MAERHTKYLSAEDKAVLATYGHNNGAGIGIRPAVLVVDVTYAFVGEERERASEAAKKCRTACGESAWQAVDALQDLLDAARVKGFPVIYTKGGPRPDLQKLGAGSLKKAQAEPVRTARNMRDRNDIVDEIAPGPADIIIVKDKPSAFFGTPLLSYLVAMRVDSLFVTGGATSGCVRASVVDAFSNNYRCTLVEDCCFDRFEASHDMSIFDLGAKYAAIANINDAVNMIRGLPDNLFALGTAS